MQCLTQGYTTMMLRSGDFILAYFCWFEDPTGLRLTPAEAVRNRVCVCVCVCVCACVCVCVCV
jgi:hypothetical protein